MIPSRWPRTVFSRFKASIFFPVSSRTVSPPPSGTLRRRPHPRWGGSVRSVSGTPGGAFHQRGAPQHQTHSGPSGAWWIVSTPRGGPGMMFEVSTLTVLPVTVILNRLRPVGAGPNRYSPALLYFEPWQGHSNHWLDWQNGTRHPRCTHFWYRVIRPCSMTPRPKYGPPGLSPSPV